MKFTLFLSVLLLISLCSTAQNAILGKWITVDDDGHTKKSIVEFYKKDDGRLYGKIVKIFPQKGKPEDPVCDQCTDDRKNQKVLGMEIIRGMTWQSGDKKWTGGTICDPENGKVYSCKLWTDNGKLKVRGYVLFLYRTQTWIRAE